MKAWAGREPPTSRLDGPPSGLPSHPPVGAMLPQCGDGSPDYIVISDDDDEEAAPAPSLARVDAAPHVPSSWRTLPSCDGSLSVDTWGAPLRPGGLAGTRAPRTSSGTSSQDMCVLCPLGCQQWIPMAEMDSHELAHQVGHVGTF